MCLYVKTYYVFLCVKKCRTTYMVITQKYRFIADLLTAWEANGYAMGVDQQLKIRELLKKIPEDYCLFNRNTSNRFKVRINVNLVAFWIIFPKM